MRRRLLLASAATLPAGAAAAARPKRRGRERQLLELRTYHFASAEKQRAFLDFALRAALPAWARAGVRPVGLFTPVELDRANTAASSTDVIVLLPHASFDALLALETTLASDRLFLEAGAAVLGAPKADPAYSRYESLLMQAFEGFPSVQPPAAAEARLFELRTYQSHNEERARNKIAMFNRGEFPIFARAGMPGVFFGAAVAGADLPQLTYMISHPDATEVKARWKAFFDDPAWKALVADPSYKDNVSRVVGRFLKPAPGSQI